MGGQVLAGRYALEELVGSGGMSSVYRAHDRLLERDVALKILHESFLEDGEAVERFRREAQAVARLSHPNVVTVIDRGEEDGSQFIVFEYVPGETLKDCLSRRGPLPVDEALSMAAEVGRALAFAHREGIVHRDVKPQNVLIDPDGRLRVTDFGIARAVDVEKSFTQTGTVLGTSDYIAPEQASGGDVVPASDVYGLGCVLFELLTGSPPFSGGSFVDVALKHINEPPPRVPGVPKRVADAVERAMAKDPAARFPSMDDFVAELDACREELSQPGEESTLVATAPPQRLPAGRRRSLGPVVLIGLGLLLLGAVVAAVIFRDDIGPDGARGSQAIALSAVASYDPQGDGEEHGEEVPNATDGNPDTYWTTERYRSPLSLIGKEGVGIVVDAGSSISPSQLVVVSDKPGFTAEIRTGDSAEGPFEEVASPQRVAASRTIFPVEDAEARYWLVWITDLDDFAHVNEVTAR